jgi:electron transport complex protein RnfB
MACRRRESMPHFITETCIGCGVCEIKCPTHTITGDKNEKYVIHADRCIDCSVCARYCPVSCIQDQKGELVEKVKPRDIPKAIVDRDLCTGCEFCIDICPFDCIYLIDDPLQETFHKIAEVDAGPCVSCRLCETVCEKDAIFVPNPITQAKRYLPVL